MPHDIERLPDWGDYLQQLQPIGQVVVDTIHDPDNPQAQQETWRSLMAMIGHGVIALVQSDPDYPEFVCVTNLAFNILTPNPDFMYTWTPVRAEGAYRLRGSRGTGPFTELTFLNGWYPMEHNNGTVGTLNLDDLTLTADGAFDVLVSPKRPADHSGDWFQMPERCDGIIVRSTCYDWVNERDSVIAIERLDVPAIRPRMSAKQLSERLGGLAKWAERACNRHHLRLKELDAQGLHNTLQMYDYSSWGGAKGQIYVEGLYSLADDEALIIETDVPDVARYWAWMVTDDQIGTIDWMNRQSSINGFQAEMDSDGKFRAVVSNRDPGIANWLDTGGYNYGMIWGRWNWCSSHPMPTLRKVRMDELDQHLPVDTPRITSETRDAMLRMRRFGAQLRRKW